MWRSPGPDPPGELGGNGRLGNRHIVHTSDQSVVLTTDEIWEAAKAAVPEASGDLVWGMTRRQLIDFLKLMLEVPPSRGRVRGKITHYWRGYRLRSDEEIEQIEQDEGQPLPGPLALLPDLQDSVPGVPDPTPSPPACRGHTL